MTIVTIIKLLLSFADGLTSYLNEKQRLDVGEKVAQSKNLQQAMEDKREADAIRERVRRGELDDPFLRN